MTLGVVINSNVVNPKISIPLFGMFFDYPHMVGWSMGWFMIGFTTVSCFDGTWFLGKHIVRLYYSIFISSLSCSVVVIFFG